MKKGLLQPMEKSNQDDNIPMENSEAYCIHHQIKDHTTNFCKALEVAILDLIDQGKYQDEEIEPKQDHMVHTISINKYIYVVVRCRCPRYAHNSITTEQVYSFIPNPIV